MLRAARSVYPSVRELNRAVRFPLPGPFRRFRTRWWCPRTGSYSDKFVSRLRTLSIRSSSMAPPLLKLDTAQIWLGSSSKSRREIMDALATEFGFTYDVCTADIDESAIRDPDPKRLVTMLARAKADAIRDKLAAKGIREGLLLTSDQVVVHNGMIWEKPADADQARSFMRQFSEGSTGTIGSFLWTDIKTGRTVEDLSVTQIEFNPIPEHVIDALIEEGEVFWCAGALMSEHALVSPYIVSMHGTLDAVMGLDKALTISLLRKLVNG